MRQGRVFYKDHLAGIITETNEGEYVFQYEAQYVKDHPNEFITFTIPVSATPPKIDYSLEQMDELAKNVVERSIAVPGVQPKLSMSLVKEVNENCLSLGSGSKI